LTLWQRLGHLEGLLHWFSCIPRLFFILLPILIIGFGIQPFDSNIKEAIYFFLPYYLTQLTAFSWLNMRSRSALLSDLYSLVQCFPLAVTVIKIILNPFAKGFQVTPKGIKSDRYYYNWKLALPLIFLLSITAVSFSIALLNTTTLFNIGLWFSIYNLITLSCALIVLLDIPTPSIYQWFPVCKKVQLKSEDRIYQGVTKQLSEEGAEIWIRKKVSVGKQVSLRMMAEDIILQGNVIQTRLSDKSTLVKIKFANLTLPQQRILVNTLYCRPDRWKTKNTPGELRSIIIMLKVLLRPLKLRFNSWQYKKSI
jgi:cellulose synthase (UDP-forming)